MPPCGWGFYVAAAYFNFIIYIVQLCEEDCTILQICWLLAFSLPRTEKIVHVICSEHVDHVVSSPSKYRRVGINKQRFLQIFSAVVKIHVNSMA